MKDHSPLYNALKQLSEDIRELVDLSGKVDEESWERMVETVKKEIADDLMVKDAQGADAMVLNALITEIYDHLNELVRSIRHSHERLRKLATRDLLTGLYNRNYFNETIVRDIRKARRYNETLTFTIIDIDNFKQVNDRFGHLHGDGVIKACAGILRDAVRESDFLCRYGGDEFIIVTPMPDCEANGPLYERINELLEDWNREFSSMEYSLSFSMGCSAWTEGKDVMDVLHEADQKMYQMKHGKKKGK